MKNLTLLTPSNIRKINFLAWLLAHHHLEVHRSLISEPKPKLAAKNLLRAHNPYHTYHTDGGNRDHACTVQSLQLARTNLALLACSVGWFVSLLVRKEVLLAGLCERKILFWLEIYDRIR